MKKSVCFLLGLAAGLWAGAQTTNLVTIEIKGNRDLKLEIDGREISPLVSDNEGNNSTFSVNDLSYGQHALRVSRFGQKRNRQESIYSVIYLRQGFDMVVKIQEDGSMEIRDTPKQGQWSKQTPMNKSSFASLLSSVRNKRTDEARKNAVSNAFNNEANYFSSSQAAQLIQLVNSQAYRLELAKQSYPAITDRENFGLVSNLLSSQSARDELAAYVRNYDNSNYNKIPMGDADFSALYNQVKNQWPASAQFNSINTAFGNPENFFSTYQAGQLIQLVTGENNRLALCKASYRSITDPDHFTQLYYLLNTQAARDELAAYVKNYDKNPVYRVAMNENDFSALYQQINNTRSAGERFNAIADAFANASYFFSTNQAGQLIQLVTGENDRLSLCKSSYRSITDPANFNQLYNLLYTQSARDELAAYVRNYDNANYKKVAMSDSDFSALYQQVKNQWPPSTQVNSIAAAFSNPANFFSTYQAGQLIQLVTGESDRLQLCKTSYRSITDPENFNQLYFLLNLQSSRDELAAYVKNYGQGSTTKTPMADADFNSLYQSVQLLFFPGERMSKLTSVFNDPKNYFTTAQAKQLIPLVSLESNRLQLAKLSYRCITDRANFTQLYDIFNNQSSKDELDAYVKGYQGQ